MKKGICLLLFCLLLIGVCCACAQEIDGGCTLKVDQQYILSTSGREEHTFTVIAGEDPAFYRIDIKNEDISANVKLELRDQHDLKMEQVTVYTQNSGFISWKAQPGAQYSLVVKCSSDKASGRVTLTLSKAPDVHADELENASTVALDEGMLTSLDGTGDKDWLTFTAQEGDAFYRVDFQNEDIPATVYVQLYDQNGLKMERINAYKGNSSFLSWPVTPGSTYSLCVYAGTKECTGRYMLTLSRQPDHEPNAIENALPIDTGAELDLSLDGTGDTDWLTFTAEEGDAFYRVDFQNADIPATVYVQLYDQDGLKMERINAYTGKTAFYSWPVTPGSAYSLCVYSGSKESTGRYMLTLSRQADKEAGTIEQAAELPANQPLTASLDGTGDVDVFKVTASADAAYYQAEFTNEMDDSRIVLQLLDHTGLALEKKDAGRGGSNAINWQPTPGEVYYLKLAASSQQQTGSYTLTLLALEDPEADTREEAGALEEGRWDCTLASASDADWFLISSESSFVQLTVRAGEQGNMKAHLYDLAGKELQSWWLNAGKEKTAVLSVDSASPCFLRITGEKVCDYTLQRTDEADLGGSSVASAFTAAAGTAVTHFEIADDVDYIAFTSADMKISLTAPQDTAVYAALTDAQGYLLGSEQRLRSGNAYVFTADAYPAFLRVRSSQIASLVLHCCTAEQHAEEPVWNILTEATCTAEGLQEQRCTLCGEMLAQEPIPMADHSAGDMRTVAEATCTAEGAKEQRCTLCNALLAQESIPALGHSAGELLTVTEAACTAEGAKEQRCMLCNELLTQESIPALGHSAGELLTVTEAACTAEGTKEQRCTLCNELLAQESIPALGHQYGEWTETKAPTRSEEGTEEQTCYRCGGTQERSVKKLTLIESIFGR